MGKIRSMHIEVPGLVAHIYHIQSALEQGGYDRSMPPPYFHQEIGYWRALAEQMASWLTHLDKIVRKDPTHLGFCDASVIRAGGM